jgi:hypothetical protein
MKQIFIISQKHIYCFIRIEPTLSFQTKIGGEKVWEKEKPIILFRV